GAHGRCVGQERNTSCRACGGGDTDVAGNAGVDPEWKREEGRRTWGGADCGDSGCEANVGSDSAVPSAADYKGGGGVRDRRGAECSAVRGAGGDAGADGCGDGGADGRAAWAADDLRHVQGGRSGDGDGGDS